MNKIITIVNWDTYQASDDLNGHQDEKMTLERAYKVIEKIYGFDDPTSAVGEAWEFVKGCVEKFKCQRIGQKESDVIFGRGERK